MHIICLQKIFSTNNEPSYRWKINVIPVQKGYSRTPDKKIRPEV